MEDILKETISVNKPDFSAENTGLLARRCIVACTKYVASSYPNLDNERQQLIIASKINALLYKLTAEVIQKIYEGKLRVKTVIETDIYDLNKELRDAKAVISDRIIEVDQTNIYDLFKCPKCKARKHLTREVQLKALDEASSSINLCLACGKRWIIHG